MKEAWIKVKHETCEEYIYARQCDVTIIGQEDIEDFEEMYGMPEEDYLDDIMYDIYVPSVDEDGEFCMVEEDGGCVMCDKFVDEMDKDEFVERVFDMIYDPHPSNWKFMKVEE